MKKQSNEYKIKLGQVERNGMHLLAVTHTNIIAAIGGMVWEHTVRIVEKKSVEVHVYLRSITTAAHSVKENGFMSNIF